MSMCCIARVGRIVRVAQVGSGTQQQEEPYAHPNESDPWHLCRGNTVREQGGLKPVIGTPTNDKVP